MQNLLLQISNLPATLSCTMFSKYGTSTILKVFRLSKLNRINFHFQEMLILQGKSVHLLFL